MKILNLIDIPWHSALAAYAFDQSSALADRGHKIYFAAPENSASAAFARAKKFPLTLIPPRKNHLLLGAVLRLKKLIMDENIDVINAHTGKAQTMAWLLSLVCAKPPALIRTKADAKHPSNSFALGKTAAIIAGSGVIKERYAAAGVDPSKVTVVYQGIAPRPEAPKEPSFPLKVGILGRLDPVKGHACFIEAAARVLGRISSVEFLIAGREEDIKYAALKALAEKLGIADSVNYLGHVADPARFARSCDIGVITSLSSEAVSRAALDWLEAGRPLLATAVGSLPEFVAPGYLVPPQNPAMLAEALCSLLRSPGKRLEAGAENRARALKDFSPARFAENTEAVFKAARPRQKDAI
ncbi:MAG: glycosyltransferase family 4 protein [Elusimicrobiales bacterium]|jgi:glycosyltransferase involved in cell wall biosynthesis